MILTSRIANHATGGEILVSALLKELTESGGDIRFGEGREVELKGLVGLNRVYQVGWEQEGAESQPASALEYSDGLTQREVEVLRLVATEKTDREIAEALVIADATVRTHISNIYSKTGANNRAEATRYALREQLISLDESPPR